MIRTIIMGGLGNQMFQYAAAYAVARRQQTPLLIDATLLQPNQNRTNATSRQQGLSLFGHISQSSRFVYHSRSTLLLYKLLPYPTIAKAFYLLIKRSYLFRDQWSTQYCSDVGQLPHNSSMMGYFQSERYFNDYKEQIRKMFSFPELPDDQTRSIGQQIGNTLSVSIHIRRGDYLSQYASCYNILDIDYYQKAIALMCERYTQPHFFVFSDDTEWAEQHIQKLAKSITIVHHNLKRDYIDLQLMSMCKHHIIANSSFSWWGAWLNPSTDKCVVAPSIWFGSGQRNEIPSDLIPDKWITI